MILRLVAAVDDGLHGRDAVWIHDAGLVTENRGGGERFGMRSRGRAVQGHGWLAGARREERA
jgi:hypothetical protein